MKTYSEITKKLYDTVEEAEQAEKEFEDAKKKAEEEKQALIDARKTRAAEVEEARKKMIEAQKDYEKVLTEFIRDYKSYHFSTTSIEDMPRLFTNPFDFDWFWKF